MSRVKIYPNSKYRQPEWDEEGTPEILSSTEESGTCNINFHGIRNKDCDLRYAVAASFRKNWLYFRPQVGAFFIKVALRNKCFYQLGKSEPRELKEGQFIVFVGKRVRCKTILPRAGEYHILEICFGLGVVNEVAAKLANLSTPELNDAPTGAPIYNSDPNYLSPAALDIIYSLIRSPFEVRKRPFYFRNKFRELLFLVLKAMEKNQRLESLDREVKVAERFRVLLLKDIQNPKAIPELAQKFEMDSGRLKQLFKHVFGMTVFHCLMQERMRVAKKMIMETTKPVNEIASLVGYKSYSRFSSAYKQYYKCTPAEQRTEKKVD